jgi:indole-3-glycerol phosphate synthase
VGFLAEIVALTRLAATDPGYAANLPARGPEVRPSLRRALIAGSAEGAVLAEFKRRSPGSPQPILPAVDAREFLARAQAPGVVGYSCLASVPRFEGSPADVARLCAQTQRPVLFKEFVVDSAQLEVAARTGAAAVLLLARLETEGLLRMPLAALAERAHGLGMEVVLEWHDRAELRQTESVPADVYGVNVRDLDTLTIDREVARRTLEAATGHRPLVGMSGVEGSNDARWFWDAGVDGILVGTALARARDPAGFLHSLSRSASEATQ